MKKIVTSFLAAVVIMLVLPAHSAVQPVKASAKAAALFKVGIRLTGANASAFYFYATNTATGAFYEFDDRECAFLLPAGTYYFGGEDATGSGWCGISGTQATICANTTVTLHVWCE